MLLRKYLNNLILVPLFFSYDILKLLLIISIKIHLKKFFLFLLICLDQSHFLLLILDRFLLWNAEWLQLEFDTFLNWISNHFESIVSFFFNSCIWFTILKSYHCYQCILIPFWWLDFVSISVLKTKLWNIWKMVLNSMSWPFIREKYTLSLIYFPAVVKMIPAK